MPIIIGGGSPVSPDWPTSTELKTALGNWSKRGSDTSVTDRYDDFITLAEARLDRELRASGMEASFASTPLTSGAVANPSGFLAWKELRCDASPVYTLEPRPIEWIRNQQDQATQPLYFAVTGTQTVCWPQSGSVMGTYYKALDSLVTNTTNWLFANHPDLYLFACLEQLAIFIADEEAEARWGARAAAIIDKLNASDRGNRIGGGPLTARAR